MTSTWGRHESGVLGLPSGRLVRGRGLRRTPAGAITPDFGLYLLAGRPPSFGWETRWIPWRDFRLPQDRDHARDLLRDAWRRSEFERVEIACVGGRGRTGTALACLAIFDGVPPAEAVAFVRQRYDHRAVETPWQRRYVRHFAPL